MGTPTGIGGGSRKVACRAERAPRRRAEHTHRKAERAPRRAGVPATLLAGPGTSVFGCSRLAHVDVGSRCRSVRARDQPSSIRAVLVVELACESIAAEACTRMLCLASCVVSSATSTSTIRLFAASRFARVRRK